MKKLILFFAAVTLLSCSSSDSSSTQDEEVTSINQLWGDWTLKGVYMNASSTNIATECDLLYGKFIFTSPADAVEKYGYMDGTCSNQSKTYDEYLIVDGQLKLYRNNYQYRYYVKKQGNKLWLTKFYTQYNSEPPVITPGSEQKTYLYNK